LSKLADSRRALEVAAQAGFDKLGERILALDVAEQFGLADYFLIISAKSDRQAKAIAEAIEQALKEAGLPVLAREGMAAGRWILLDFGDLVVHIMLEEERDFYGLERMWRDCALVSLELN
jgi:ribosome-associated protein